MTAIGLYAPPSNGLRKITEAWIPAWTELENVPVESGQQTALTFRDRALTGVVESRQQATLYFSTPGSRYEHLTSLRISYARAMDLRKCNHQTASAWGPRRS